MRARAASATKPSSGTSTNAKATRPTARTSDTVTSQVSPLGSSGETVAPTAAGRTQSADGPHAESSHVHNPRSTPALFIPRADRTHGRSYSTEIRRASRVARLDGPLY